MFRIVPNGDEFSEDLTPLHHDVDQLLNGLIAQSILAVVDVPIMVTDPEGRLLYASQKFMQLHGVPIGTPFETSIQSVRFFRVDGMTPLPTTQAPLALVMRGEELNGYEYCVLLKDGELRYRKANGRQLRDKSGTVIALVLALHDVTDQRSIESDLVHQAQHDALTSLPNRALLETRLERAMNRARKHSSGLGVFFLDLDHFKVLNDGLGHSVGDQLLVETAHRLRLAARSSDTVARLGGDEFVVIAEGLSTAKDLMDLAERIRYAINQPVSGPQGQILPTCSIGIAAMSDESTPESLLRDADTAMYSAKEAGRNQSRLFSEPLRHDAVRRVATQRVIQEALDQRRLHSYVQPIVDAKTRELVGVEALARCATADGRMLNPGDFMTVAEDTGLVTQIDEWMLRSAGAAVLGWGAYDPRSLTLSWNASARLLAMGDLAGRVSRILDELNFPPRRLRIELTESALIRATPAMLTQLEQLRASGAEIGLDDFGTGYSPLTFLRDMPVSFVKIDKGFVQRMVMDSSSQAIIDAIVRLAHALGIRVIAEGVETDRQADILQRLECDQLQGFLFAQPMEPAAYPPLVAARRSTQGAEES
ncbi:MAG: EAL domain-containing protein [Acidimicrobiia bacterium]